MMGLPQGWVTALDLPHTAQLRALGNGVVPAQAAYAIDLLSAIEDNGGSRLEAFHVRDEGAR